MEKRVSFNDGYGGPMLSTRIHKGDEVIVDAKDLVEWMEQQRTRLKDEHRRGYRDGVLEARRRIAQNGSLVGAATNDWFDAVAADSAEGKQP